MNHVRNKIRDSPNIRYISTIYSRVAGIEKEIGKRYNRYAICENLISIAVYVDYEKYHKRLADKNLRKTVPAFNMEEAKRYLGELKMPIEREEDADSKEYKDSNTIIIVSMDDKKMQKLVEYIKTEIQK